MAQLDLTNVVNISVSAAQAGIGDYNTSNLALFTRDVAGGGFGSRGFKIYLDPSEVATDFGSSSATFKMANTVFSQKPNILAGNGYLVVIPMLTVNSAVIAVQQVSFSSVPASGTYRLKYGLNETTDLAFNASASAVQTALRLLAGLSSVTVSGNTSVGFQVTFTGVSGPATLLQITNDSLQDSGTLDVFVTAVTTTVGVAANSTPETLDAAILRTQSLVQYFGIMVAEITVSVDLLAAAAVVQGLNKLLFDVQRDPATVDPGGLIDLIRSNTFTNTRCRFYGAAADLPALLMSAAYAGRALSTNFNGNNTTETMHLKDLIGIDADSSMTQTLLTACQSAGADVYASFQGVAKVFCSGANQFFDQVYNLQWLIGALQVAGFNALAQAANKLPQTEDGMLVLKGAYRNVCEQAVVNQYSAPGEWNSSTTFGVQSDFLRNIQERGYYIYSAPVAQQSQTQRNARVAPLVQIAIKEAGAIHSSDVIIFVNA